jgi:hypothetical protein
LASLPDAPTLAALVSGVTRTMCGTNFVPAGDPLARGESLCGTMFLLPLAGERKISIVLACDERAGRALSRALLHIGPDEVTRELIDEAIRELLNMIAGKVTAALRIDQALGLPRRTTLAEICSGGLAMDDTVLLSSQGQINLRLWVFEQGAQHDDAKTATPKRGWLRSLLRRVSGPT